jgi:hypothetical protein
MRVCEERIPRYVQREENRAPGANLPIRGLGYLGVSYLNAD